MKAAKNTSAAAKPSDLAAMLWPVSGFLFGLMLIWSFLAPVDATSVFEGAAQPQNLFWLVLCACLSGAVVATGQALRLARWHWLLLSLSLGWLILLSVFAGEENNARTAWYGFWQVVSLAGCFYCARCLLAGPRSRAAALQLILTGCLALAVHGVYQVAIELPANRARFEADPESVLRLAGLDAPAGSPLRKSFKDRLDSPEPFATFALANSLAVVLSGGLVLAIAFAGAAFKNRFDDRSATSRSALAIVAACAIVALILATWFLARSRTAYLAVMLALAAWALYAVVVRRRERKPLQLKFVLAIGGLALLLLLAGVFWLVRNDRFVLSEAAKSLLFRMEYWQATVAMIGDHWLGVGLGNFQSYYPQYMLATASETIADPHNWFLDIAISLSPPIACLFATWLLVQFAQPLATSNDPDMASGANEASGHDATLSRSLLRGGAIGGAFCLIAIWLLQGIDIEGVATAWAIAIPLGWAVRRLAHRMLDASRIAIRLSAGAMVLCLFASGSWQASGIAIPCLSLLACSLREPKCSTSAEGRRLFGRLPTLVLPVLGLCFFIFQSWLPTTRCWSLIQQSGLATSLNEHVALTRSAAEADPLDSEPLRRLAHLLTTDAMSSPNSLFERKAQLAIGALDEWLEADRIKSLNWQFAGDRALELAAQHARLGGADHRGFLLNARDYYAQATRQQPTSARLHVQLAAVLALLSDIVEAKAEIKVAVELSGQTPHADKKIFAQQIWLPLLPEKIARFDGSYVPAEPVAEWIRSL